MIELKRPIYLDYAATTPLLPEVGTSIAMTAAELSSDEVGNPASIHLSGRKGRQFLEYSRIEIAQLINAEPDEIVFTSGGTEANNTVMGTFAGKKITVSAIEHPSVLEAARRYAKKLQELPVDEYGFVDLETPIPEDTALISVMLANNEIGTIEPIKKIRKKYPKIALHTDATQAVGKIPVDVKALGVDYLTFSAHKLGGPVGIGVLYVRRGCRLAPLLVGGHQEQGRRAGTANVLLAVGFAAAVREAEKRLEIYQTEIAETCDLLRESLKMNIPDIIFNTPKKNALPNILNVSFKAVEGEAVQLHLDLAGIEVSTGSACASEQLEPSHVIMATRHDAEIAHGSIRISLGSDNTIGDVDYLMSILPDIVEKLRGISTITTKD